MTPTRTITLALASILISASSGWAQNGNGHSNGHSTTGRIVGKVVDAQYGTPLSGAQVSVAGTSNTVTSAVDGRYTLLNVPADAPVEIRVRRIGYQPKAVSEVVVPPGRGVEQDVALTAEVFQMDAISVTATAERGAVSSALEEIRNAPSMMNTLPAELMRKSPDGDAGQAVQRVAGVTVQDGKYVFVRGLGERYTTTSLNNARIPSPEPERKVVPLDMFPSSLLDQITTSKTFTPEQPGDFSGAQVNLRTREFPLGRKIAFSSSVGVNDAIAGKPVLRAPSVGREWLGFAGDARAIPATLGSLQTLSGQSQDQLNAIAASFRNVWSAANGQGSANRGFSASVGGEDPVFGLPIGYLGSLTYSLGDDVRRDERRAIAVTGDGPSGTRPQNEYRGSTGTSGVLWGGLLNLSARLGSTAKISVNNAYTRGGDNQATRMAGFNEEFNRTFDITRLTFTERTVRSTQLVGEVLIAGRHTLDWSGTTSGVTRYEPDRSDLVYEADVDTTTGASQPTAWFGAARSATRTFSDLGENALDGAVNVKLALGSSRNFVKLGAMGRMADRDADTRAYDLIGFGLTEAERAQPAEVVLGPSTAMTGRLFLNANSNGGRYSASERLFASYAQLELALGQRVRVIGGARVERAFVTVDTRTTQGQLSRGKLDDIDVLPSIAVTFELTRSQNLRVSATQTLSRPEYRELSEVPYADILGGLTVRGNSGLKRALIQNFDVRWEIYPGPSEVVSLAGFAKHFTNPIEKIMVGSTGAPTLSFVNATGAINYGLEIELRKNLGSIADALQPFNVFTNATIMRSRIETGSDISALTNDTRSMVGQAPYVVNAGLSYGRGPVSATVLYNVVGRRIVEGGLLPRPDTYEEPRHVIDFSLVLPFIARGQLKLDGKNLLDSPYKTLQGNVIRHQYWVGRSFSLGLSWTL